MAYDYNIILPKNATLGEWLTLKVKIFERAAIAERSYKRLGHTVLHKCLTKTGYVGHVTFCRKSLLYETGQSTILSQRK